MRRMSRPKLSFSITAVFSCLLIHSLNSTVCGQEKSFDHLLDQKVVVTQTGIKIEVPGKQPQSAKIGQSFTVSQIKDSWLWVNQVGGWLDAEAVVLLNEAEQHFTQQLKESPSASRFMRGR